MLRIVVKWRKLIKDVRYQDGCEWVNVFLVLAYPGNPGPKADKRLCVCVLKEADVCNSTDILFQSTRHSAVDNISRLHTA